MLNILTINCSQIQQTKIVKLNSDLLSDKNGKVEANFSLSDKTKKFKLPLTRKEEGASEAQQKFPKAENIQNHKKSSPKNPLRKQQKNSVKNLLHFLGKIFFK